MNKQYFFLSGLFRSGNTVLSSILNQNPKIYSSPISSLVEHMWQSNLVLKNFQASVSNLDNHERSKSLISSMIGEYYKDVNKEVIFDRTKGWINPANITMLRDYVSDNPKIVFTTRPILEIMASYIAISKDGLVAEMNNSEFVHDIDLSVNDNLADYLFSHHSNFGSNLRWALESIDKPENNGVIHLVKYEELLSSPQQTMDSIYDFLGIDRFSHDFDNILKLEDYREDIANLPQDLHNIRKSLSRGEVVVSDYLSPRTISKYSEARYF